MLRQENEDVIDNFLAQNLEYHLVNISGLLDKSFPLAQNNVVAPTDSFFKLFPHINGTDGFFCAVLERQSVR
jgi:16S rRNA (cytosine967-C5)-methyltransferase